MTKKVYISGAITDHSTGKTLPGYLDKFQRAEDLVRACGYEPINPTKLDHAGNQTWEQFMRTDLAAMLHVDALCVLPCAGGSRGAKVEIQLAHDLGIPVVMHSKFIKGNHAAAINKTL